LREAGERQLKKYLANQIGKEFAVLIEKNFSGKTENFLDVKISDGKNLKSGEIVEVQVYETEGNFLIAKNKWWLSFKTKPKSPRTPKSQLSNLEATSNPEVTQSSNLEVTLSLSKGDLRFRAWITLRQAQGDFGVLGHFVI